MCVSSIWQQRALPEICLGVCACALAQKAAVSSERKAIILPWSPVLWLSPA